MEQNNLFTQSDICLIQPSEQFQHEIMDFREEFLRNHETAYGTEQLTDAASFEVWLKNVQRKCRKRKTTIL